MMLRISILSLVSLMLLFPAVSYAADVVVLSANGADGLTVGKVLSTDDEITIEEGGSIVLITSNGLKVQVNGPFKGSLDKQLDATDKDGQSSADGNMVAALSRLFSSPTFSTKSMGAFRSVGTPTLSDPWAFDVSKGGAVCFQNARDLKLWRATVEDGNVVSIIGSAASVMFEFPDQQTMVGWPADIPLTNDGVYSVKVEGLDPVEVTARSVPSDLPTRMHIAAWMSEHGCDTQATLLIVNADIDKLLKGLAQAGKF